MLMDGHYALNSRVDEWASRGVQKFVKLTGMNHWNAGLKTFVGAIFSDQVLNAAAKAWGVTTFGAQWAGAGADQARTLPAQELVHALMTELEAAI